MRPDVVRPGLTAGVVASAATLGALLAIGHRIGRSVLPIGTIGALVAGRHSFLFGDPATNRDIIVGVLVQVAICLMWGIVTVWLSRDRGVPLGWAALVVAVADFASSWIIARGSGNGLATVVPLGHRLELALVLGVALVAGTRLALSSVRE